VVCPAKEAAELIMDLDVFMPLREEVIEYSFNLQAGNSIAKDKGNEENDTEYEVSPLYAKFSKLFHMFCLL
jgi:hypothetical protein